MKTIFSIYIDIFDIRLSTTYNFYTYIQYLYIYSCRRKFEDYFKIIFLYLLFIGFCLGEIIILILTIFLPNLNRKMEKSFSYCTVCTNPAIRIDKGLTDCTNMVNTERTEKNENGKLKRLGKS